MNKQMDHYPKLGSRSYTSIRKNSTAVPNIGTNHDIPDDICTMARLKKNDVVAWTTFSSDYYNEINRFSCFSVFGAFFIFPCFLPHMIMLFPCLWAFKVETERKIKNTFWVLTETDLKVIVQNYDRICCSCYSVGENVTSIPYDSITDCRTTAPNSGCLGSCGSIPTIYVVTSRNYSTSSTDSESSGPRYAAVGYGLAGYDWIATEILARREALKRNYYAQEIHGIEMSNMDRGMNKSVESRLQKIKELQKLGTISTEEYEKKREEIIASI